MSAELVVRRAGAGVTVQDLGRTGYVSQGLSRGGAADPGALAEGAALLNQPPELAAIEITGSALEVEASAPMCIAVTGAPMRAKTNQNTLIWNASYALGPGERLSLSPTGDGLYSYLHVAGGIDTPLVAHGRSAHLATGIGRPLEAGDRLPVGPDKGGERLPARLPAAEPYAGGDVRFLAGPQTALFPGAMLERFCDTQFTRTAWGNRQGVKLGYDGDGFQPSEGLSLLSEFVVPGDIQITGDGTPYVLGPECQTTGGYPRIGSVVPQDLTKVLQATPGSPLNFRMVGIDEALHDYRTPLQIARDAANRITPLVRDPGTIKDLLAYQLISGVVSGKHHPESEDS